MALMRWQRGIPPYTAIVGLLVLALTIAALIHDNPLGYILATVLVLFIGAPALVIWAHARRERGLEVSDASIPGDDGDLPR
jgi:protein-S-isoprenylcysteine O-methyltransferase Ste14